MGQHMRMQNQVLSPRQVPWLVLPVRVPQRFKLDEGVREVE
jgi:hypothetical protein